MKNKFRFEVIGYGFERVYASLDKKKYQYWLKNNLNDLIENTNLVEKNEHLLFKDGDWDSFDDLGHYEGARFNEDSELVVYDNKDKEIFRTLLGEWNLDNENQELIDSDEFYLNSLDNCKYAFIGESILTGCFIVGFHEIAKFDKHKIGFNTLDVNGDVIVVGLMYDNEEISFTTNDLTVDSLELRVIEV
jgi:hypothetical protein